jgi:hypothetical protein
MTTEPRFQRRRSKARQRPSRARRRRQAVLNTTPVVNTSQSACRQRSFSKGLGHSIRTPPHTGSLGSEPADDPRPLNWPRAEGDCHHFGDRDRKHGSLKLGLRRPGSDRPSGSLLVAKSPAAPASCLVAQDSLWTGVGQRSRQRRSEWCRHNQRTCLLRRRRQRHTTLRGPRSTR